MNVDQELEEYLRPLFGDMAPMAIETQKEKLGLKEKDLNPEEYKEVANSIKAMCEDMAGAGIAEKIYEGLLEIIETAKAN